MALELCVAIHHPPKFADMVVGESGGVTTRMIQYQQPILGSSHLRLIVPNSSSALRPLFPKWAASFWAAPLTGAKSMPAHGTGSKTSSFLRDEQH